MNQENRKTTIRNSLKRNAIHVYVKEKRKQRRGALPDGKSLLQAGADGLLTGLAGKNDISLIIKSQLVPGRGANTSEGILVAFSDLLSPSMTELLSIPNDEFEMSFYFKSVFANNTSDPEDDKPGNDEESDVDVDVKHPEDDEEDVV